MTARWQVSTVLALAGRTAPHPDVLARHVGGLVATGAHDDVLTLVARVPGRSADDAVRELTRRLAPLDLARARRCGLHVQRVRRLGRSRTPLVLAWADGGGDGSAGVREPRRPRPPASPAARVLALPR